MPYSGSTIKFLSATGPGEVDWSAMTTAVSTEFLKFACASPAGSAADFQHGNGAGVEVEINSGGCVFFCFCEPAVSRRRTSSDSSSGDSEPHTPRDQLFRGPHLAGHSGNQQAAAASEELADAGIHQQGDGSMHLPPLQRQHSSEQLPGPLQHSSFLHTLQQPSQRLRSEEGAGSGTAADASCKAAQQRAESAARDITQATAILQEAAQQLSQRAQALPQLQTNRPASAAAALDMSQVAVALQEMQLTRDVNGAAGQLGTRSAAAAEAQATRSIGLPPLPRRPASASQAVRSRSSSLDDRRNMSHASSAGSAQELEQRLSAENAQPNSRLRFEGGGSGVGDGRHDVAAMHGGDDALRTQYQECDGSSSIRGHSDADGSRRPERLLVIKFLPARLDAQSEQFASELARHLGIASPACRILRKQVQRCRLPDW